MGGETTGELGKLSGKSANIVCTEEEDGKAREEVKESS